MDEEYEIIVYEHNSMYDSRDANAANVLDVFFETCREYVNPEYVGQDSVHLDSSKRFVSYADRSGNDKPMLVILIGTITDEMLLAIQDGLKKMYMHFCEDCGKEMVFLRTGVLVCNKC
jgi:hypothetical protein